MATVTVGLQLPVIAFWGSLLLSCCISVCTGDVPDNVVYTDLHKTIQTGSQAVLKCHFYGEPNAVYWKKGNDPSTSPNLAVWVDGGLHSGLCLLDKMCAMGDDYSLVIKNVSIADQGRYICKVSNYRGILIHNFTEVNVFALPEEPYPIIDECKENREENCTLLVTHATNITCTVLKYFPNVDLFFLHGVQKYTTSETLVWTNSDGTKSKSISTNALPSEIPYVCVAYNIPGSPDQRTSTVTVKKLLSPSQTSEPLQVNESPVVKIVVTVAVVCVVAGAGMITIFIIYWRKHTGREKQKDEETDLMLKPLDIKGKISFYELWLLVSELTKDEMNQLRQTFRELDITSIAIELSKRGAYENLCTWKGGNQTNDEATILHNAFIKAHFSKGWKHTCDSRGNTETTVPRETLEHLLWHIEDTDKMYHFLQELMPDFAVVNFTTSERKKAVEVALDELVKWNNRPFEVNPLVSLSLALERARCSPVDRTFFLVPKHLQASILPKEVQGLTDKLAGRHCKRLAMTLKISSKDVDTIILGNNFLLFNTHLMIKEWLSEVECSNYEKRCRIDDALVKIGRCDLQDYFGTLKHRFGHLNIGDVREQPHPKFHDDFECLERPNATKYVYQAELTRIAFNLLMEDVRPLTEALGINQSTMKKYIRPMPSQGDPDKCTRDLLVKLIEGSIHRHDFGKTLENLGFAHAASTVYFDYEISLSEVMNIIACVGEDDMDGFLENLDISEDDKAECRDSKGQIDKLKVMRLWKHQIRPVPYYYRVEITLALRDAGLDKLADDVLAGKHQKKRPNPDVLQDICSRLSFSTLREVGNLLGLGFNTNREGSTALLSEWVDEWMTKFNTSDPNKERKRVNDLLFSRGFHELAEEISALENCHGY